MKLKLNEGEKLIIENIDGATFVELKRNDLSVNDIYVKHTGVIYNIHTIQENGYHFFWNEFTERQFEDLPLEEIIKDRVEVSFEEFISIGKRFTE